MPATLTEKLSWMNMEVSNWSRHCLNLLILRACECKMGLSELRWDQESTLAFDNSGGLFTSGSGAAAILKELVWKNHHPLCWSNFQRQVIVIRERES